MFAQNTDEKKLDWMYKNPTSLVDREEYLLGRSVDKTLEQLNAEEKQKQSNISLPQPKNHVEHECIPPSIRDFKLQQIVAEQVDLSAKLQEDPVVAIKKREEETRRQFLQNPVQLKKLQEALKAREQQVRTKKKKSKRSAKDLDKKIVEKLQLLKTGGITTLLSKKQKKKKKAEEQDALNTILMHKFNELKDKLTDDDLRDILSGKVSGSESSSESSGEEERKKSSKKKKRKEKKKKKRTKGSRSSIESDSDEESEKDVKKRKSKGSEKQRDVQRGDKSTNRSRSRSGEDRRDYSRRDSSRTTKAKDRRDYDRKEERDRKKFDRQSHSASKERNYKKANITKSKARTSRSRSESESDYDSRKGEKRGRNKNSESESDSEREKYKTHRSESSDDGNNQNRRNYGLVKADGSKIKLSEKSRSDKRVENVKKVPESSSKSAEKSSKPIRLSEEEKERRRREMLENAVWRDKERERNVNRYRESDAKESKQDFDPDFVHKELLKSANSSTVESRIKANINKIQRSKSDMNAHFSRRN